MFIYVVGAHVTSCCYIVKVIRTLNEHLDDDNMSRFKLSCFGHFLEFPTNKFLAQLAYHSLLQMKVGYNHNAIFQIGGTEVTISPQDFYLITGLGFMGRPELPDRSDIHDFIFGGAEAIYMNNIEDAFLKVSKTSKGRGIMTFKLGILWFVYAVLFGRHPSHKKINVKYMHLVDDLNSFDAYPWGLKAYEFFIKKLCRARRILDGNEAAGLAFELYGFTYVLQVWLFETCPQLAAFCARHVDPGGKRMPRILCWSATSVRKYASLRKFFKPDAKMKLVIYFFFNLLVVFHCYD